MIPTTQFLNAVLTKSKKRPFVRAKCQARAKAKGLRKLGKQSVRK